MGFEGAETEAFYTLAFFLVSFLIVFPSEEVKSAGLTVENLFGNYLGDPNLTFILYHLRRIAITKCIHSLLPLTYCIGLLLVRFPVSSSDGGLNYVAALTNWSENMFWYLMGSTMCLGFAVIVITSVLVSIFNDWSLNGLAMKLARHSTRGSWHEVAVSIDTEIRRIDKFKATVGNSIVYVTDTWLIQVNPYSVDVMHQGDVQLELCKADEFALSPESNAGAQFLEIQVTSRRNTNNSFIIRLNSLDFRELKAKLRAPVENARNIVIQQSLSEKFIQAFCETIVENPKSAVEETEQCIGCMQADANVMLVKRCAGDDEGSRCQRCFCRPMWCSSCMARWFASRQEDSSPETWLGGNSPCPTCRSIFCILDVSLIQE